jgi:hypothetical protein
VERLSLDATSESKETPTMMFVSYLHLGRARRIGAPDAITRSGQRLVTSSWCRSLILIFDGIGIASAG